MNITIKIKQVYGRETIYPVCDKAILFASLCGTSTLTPRAMGIIEQLGYQVLVQSNAPACWSLAPTSTVN